MRTSKVRFPNDRGIELTASLDLPASAEPHAYAVFAHCFTCHRNYRFIRQIARALTQSGFGVLRLDFMGLGESGGRFEDSNFSSNVGDVRAAANFLATHHRAPALLIGHSLGGTAMLAAAPHFRSVKAVAIINSPSAPAHVLSQLAGVENTVASSGEARVEIGGLSYLITAQLVEDLRAQHPAIDIAELDAALLLLHAPDDRTVDFDHAQRLYAAARHPKSLVALPGADHLLSRETDALYVAAMIATWSTAYLGADECEASA
ncbi:MAG: lysophospholipase [Chromatiales bacterium]|jgi:putative redox protein|nr:lysophospholipase [Chromatiales bacterium]